MLAETPVPSVGDMENPKKLARTPSTAEARMGTPITTPDVYKAIFSGKKIRCQLKEYDKGVHNRVQL